MSNEIKYLSFLLICILFSCQQENMQYNQHGSLSLLMDTKSGTDIPAIMKSTSTVDVDTFHIVIKDAGGQPIKQNFDTFAELKKYTDQTASYFQSLGIGHGDMVMLILKRRYEFWFSIIALHKLGAVVIPATHLLTKKDIVYRANAADIKMIVCAGEEVITKHIIDAMPDSPSVKTLVSIGPDIPEGFEDFHKGIRNAAPFVRPEHPNSNDDISLMYFTSGTTGNPKMVAHDFTYPLGHIVTGSFWHNLNEDSLHLTIADTGWGKAVWGKLYGQWIAGATVFVYDHEKFTPANMLQIIQEYRITSL